jgi:hypothetical protein
MMPNKSTFYLLPLIKGWSAEADFPINCFAKTEFPDCIIARYDKEKIPHDEGIIHHETKTTVDIIHLIRQRFMDDCNLILKGKYSQISDAAKDLIISRYPSEYDFQTAENVLYKSKNLKKHLEHRLGMTNLDEYIDEYESIMGDEEKLILELV